MSFRSILVCVPDCHLHRAISISSLAVNALVSRLSHVIAFAGPQSFRAIAFTTGRKLSCASGVQHASATIGKLCTDLSDDDVYTPPTSNIGYIGFQSGRTLAMPMLDSLKTSITKVFVKHVG